MNPKIYSNELSDANYMKYKETMLKTRSVRARGGRGGGYGHSTVEVDSDIAAFFSEDLLLFQGTVLLCTA